LPIERFRGVNAAGTPLFVSQTNQVIDANRQARQCGIQPGMTPTAARALTASGHHQTRDPEGEQRLLEHLATWALQFTPRVSIEPPAALLLEIAGSLRYFQGIAALRQRLSTGLAEHGHEACISVAPTPTGAWLLARAGDDRPVKAHTLLSERLDALPVEVMALTHQTMDALQGLGCATLGALRALPRAGATRRLGRIPLETLQRAYGERPDPRQNWQPPEDFERHIDCLEAIENHDGLRPLFQSLVDDLCTALRYRDAGVMRLRFSLWHRDGEPTRITLGVLSPTRDAAHLQWLAEQQLDNLTLCADVVAVSLRANRFHTMVTTRQVQDLFDRDDEQARATGWRRLIEAFNSRLGEEQVCVLRHLADHRPERAWCYQRVEDALCAPTTPPLTARPAWLLERPVPLTSPRGRPQYDNAPLILESGPERIETGWWDGMDVTRDYYQARTPRGRRIWIFRDRRGMRDWYLHGVFA
jgi:protein ImuB